MTSPSWDGRPPISQDVSGYHWLQVRKTTFIACWHRLSSTWTAASHFYGPAEAARFGWTYLGPVAPYQDATPDAERDADLARYRDQNDKLCAILAASTLNCIYCDLSKDDMPKCASGFPGCGRADDLSMGGYADFDSILSKTADAPAPHPDVAQARESER